MENILKFQEVKKVGFTGTQIGMSDNQKEQFLKYFKDLFLECEYIEFHHGDCVGADCEAHEIARNFGCYIIIHPPTNSSKRAFCKGDKILNPKEYLERNHDIVDSCEILICAPKNDFEELRSGTWSTYRYAKKKKKEIKILKR